MEISLLRLPAACNTTGDKPSTFYEKQARGLLPRPVNIGGRARAYPSNELQQIVQARIAGRSEAEIRALVEALHAARHETL